MRHRQRWRERPSGRARGHCARARPGRSRHRLCSDRDIGTRQWAAKNAAHTTSVRPLNTEILRAESIAAMDLGSSTWPDGSERTNCDHDLRGRPQFPRSSPRLSSAVGVRRRQPGERDEGTAARARRTRPVRARGRSHRPQWASLPSRGWSAARPTTVGTGLHTAASGRRPRL